MNTRPLLCIILFSSAQCVGLALAAEPSSAVGSTAGGAPAASASEPLTPGSWQTHQYTFQFMGFTSTYSCDGLADRLKVLLLAAGARADVKSQPGACAAPLGRPDKFARADLTFYTLAPLAADAAESGEKPVSGGWRAIAFANQLPRGLQIGDCEVVEQFRTNLLPMFTARNIVDQTTCIPYQQSGSVINLKFEVFAPPPRRAAKK